MHFLLIFAAGYASVFLLGFQSRVVNHGNFAAAAFCSFAIALSQGMLWSRIMVKDAGFPEYFTYGLSGACAITSAMWVHRRLFVKK